MKRTQSAVDTSKLPRMGVDFAFGQNHKCQGVSPEIRLSNVPARHREPTDRRSRSRLAIARSLPSFWMLTTTGGRSRVSRVPRPHTLRHCPARPEIGYETP